MPVKPGSTQTSEINCTKNIVHFILDEHFKILNTVCVKMTLLGVGGGRGM